MAYPLFNHPVHHLQQFAPPPSEKAFYWPCLNECVVGHYNGTVVMTHDRNQDLEFKSHFCFIMLSLCVRLDPNSRVISGLSVKAIGYMLIIT